MSYQPHNYVPKKNKINWISVLIVFVVVISFFAVLQFIQSYERKEEINYYGICGYNDRQTRELLENEAVENKLSISDYLYYGETLNLYQDSYQLSQNDEMHGKTIILKNLCTNEELVYILEKQVDGQIPVENLEVGFYSVLMLEDIDTYHLYFEDEVYDEFYTVTRNETNKKITLMADKTMFDDMEDAESYLDKHYLYLSVEEEINSEVVDIVIDPGHFSNDAGNYVEKGLTVNGRTEAEETYKVAELLAAELEKYGFNVLVTRNSSTDIVNSYGVNGRLYKGYETNAKYYVDIQMKSASNSNVRGTQVIYSTFSSNRFAQTVYKSIVEGTSLVTTGNGSVEGVLPGGLLDGYDGRMMIRESGGRILGAGTFSEKSQEENAKFAAENRYGMQAITIEYAYLSNPIDMQIWDSELDVIAEKTAEGIARYLGVEK